MEWLKKHADAIFIASLIAGGFLWTDGKIEKINDKLSSLDKEMSNVKTVLILKGIYPQELGTNYNKE